jgi:etoposide-induced 2.4 mRNA
MFFFLKDIADSAYKFRKGRPQYIPTISKLIADVLMNLLVEALFLGQVNYGCAAF